MNKLTNIIINAVYLDEWQLIENELQTEIIDNAYAAAEFMAAFVGSQLYRNTTAQLPETVDWLLRQPYIDRQTFCKWVVKDALKHDTLMHRIILDKVAIFCS